MRQFAQQCELWLWNQRAGNLFSTLFPFPFSHRNLLFKCHILGGLCRLYECVRVLNASSCMCISVLFRTWMRLIQLLLLTLLQLYANCQAATQIQFEWLFGSGEFDFSTRLMSYMQLFKNLFPFSPSKFIARNSSRLFFIFSFCISGKKIYWENTFSFVLKNKIQF